MKEIKFRAWDIVMRKMFPPRQLTHLTIAHLIPDWVELGTPTVQLLQYIGLRDKNGQEGYFDDLVKWGKAIYQVMWNDVEGIAQLVKCSGTEVFSTLCIKEIENGKIVGNTHENPELVSPSLK